MTWLLAFGRFWYDFIVGDDWRVGAGVIVAAGLTAVLAHTAPPSWWVMPVVVALTFAGSLRHATSVARVSPAGRRRAPRVEGNSSPR